MGNTCQHCGAQLPRVVDAFCPNCRGALDEAPAPRPVAGTPAGATGDAEPPVAPPGARNWLVGAAVGAAIGGLVAFFMIRGEDVTARTIGAALTRAVLGGSILGALVGAASNWRK